MRPYADNNDGFMELDPPLEPSERTLVRFSIDYPPTGWRSLTWDMEVQASFDGWPMIYYSFGWDPDSGELRLLPVLFGTTHTAKSLDVALHWMVNISAKSLEELLYLYAVFNAQMAKVEAQEILQERRDGSDWCDLCEEPDEGEVECAPDECKARSKIIDAADAHMWAYSLESGTSRDLAVSLLENWNGTFNELKAAVEATLS